MGARQKEWARRARAKLKEELGGCCVQCGTKRKLTFDCIVPVGEGHHRMDTSARMSFYHGQHVAKNLQILCKKHNEQKADQVPFQYEQSNRI